jgi:hypothetical protein
VTLAEAGPDCLELRLGKPCALAEPAGVALEDYARELSRARAAEVVRAEDDPSRVVAVHVCGPQVALTAGLVRDVEDFAHQMAASAGQGGLGWS